MLSRKNVCVLDILIIDKCGGNSLMSYICMQKKKNSTNFCLWYIKYMRMQIKKIMVKTSIFFLQDVKVSNLESKKSHSYLVCNTCFHLYIIALKPF